MAVLAAVLAAVTAAGAIVTGVAASVASAAALTVGVLGIAALAVANGFWMKGRPTPTHHLMRLVVAALVLAPAWIAVP